MDVIFDGCTEILLQSLKESNPETSADADALLKQLSEFRKECVKVDICPEGELIRSWVCRKFLREAKERMQGKLKSVDEDNIIREVMRSTGEYIETLGEETEAERAYIVVRNLIIISENIAKQTKKQKIPNLAKKSVQMINYHIDLKGIKEFEEIAGFTWEKDIQKLLKLKLPPMTAKSYCEVRYRHLFFNLLVRLVTIRETIEGR